MALAPRTDRHTANDRVAGSVRDSGLGAAGKKQQRARNADSPTKSLTKNSGSSGKALSVAQMPKIEFDTLLPHLTHLTDIACKINHVQAATGWATASISIPLEYLHDVMEAHLASQQGMVFMQVYYAPLNLFQPDGETNGAEQPA